MKILIVGMGSMGNGFHSIARMAHPGWEFKFHSSKDSWASLLEKIAWCDAVVIAISTRDNGWAEKEIILAAMRAGKPAVTCAKGALSEFPHELLPYADRIGSSATAGGGSNIQCLLRATIGTKRIFGILNGTFNYLSWSIERGRDLTEAIIEAQNLRLCEPGSNSPGQIASSESIDACRKAVIIHNKAYPGSLIRFSEMSFMTFSDDGAFQLFRKRKDELGPRRLVVSIIPSKSGDGLMIRNACFWTRTQSHLVIGQFMETDGIFPKLPEREDNCLLVEDYGGRSFVSGKGAGIRPTAAAMLTDLHLLLNTSG